MSMENYVYLQQLTKDTSGMKLRKFITLCNREENPFSYGVWMFDTDPGNVILIRLLLYKRDDQVGERSREDMIDGTIDALVMCKYDEVESIVKNGAMKLSYRFSGNKDDAEKADDDNMSKLIVRALFDLSRHNHHYAVDISDEDLNKIADNTIHSTISSSKYFNVRTDRSACMASEEIMANILIDYMSNMKMSERMDLFLSRW